jgi:hypothetical protein
MGLGIFDEKAPITNWGVFGDFSSTDRTNVFNSPFGGICRLDILTLSTDKATDTLIRVGLGNTTDSGPITNFISALTLPANAGNGTVPAFDVLASLPASYAGGIVLAATVAVFIAMDSALGGSEHVYFAAFGGVV